MRSGATVEWPKIALHALLYWQLYLALQPDHAPLDPAGEVGRELVIHDPSTLIGFVSS